MKPVYYNVIVLLFMLMTAYSTAQDQKLYSFSLKETTQLLTYSQNDLIMSDAQTGINKIAQCFIVKRLSGGRALIAPAAKPGLFLKRDNGGVILTTYTEGDATFEWNLRYSGYPWLSIAEPGASNVLSWQAGSGFSLQAISAALTNNDDTAGDHYRFAISDQTNTF